MIYKITDKCTCCGLCAKKCPEDVIIKKDGKYFITDNCVSCGICFKTRSFKTITTFKNNNFARGRNI